MNAVWPGSARGCAVTVLLLVLAAGFCCSSSASVLACGELGNWNCPFNFEQDRSGVQAMSMLDISQAALQSGAEGVTYAITSDAHVFVTKATKERDGSHCGAPARQGDNSTAVNSAIAKAVMGLYEGVTQSGGTFGGHIVVGDLTEYARQQSYQTFKSIYVDDKPYAVFPGLGNHDVTYPGIVNKCFDRSGWACANGVRSPIVCPSEMALAFPKLIRYTDGADVDASSFAMDATRSGRLVTGSLAYAWTKGGYRFIHGNINPYISMSLTDEAYPDYGLIYKPSMPFIKAQVETATKAGQKAVLLIHDVQRPGRCEFLDRSWPECDEPGARDLTKDAAFMKMLRKNSVVGIFRGHTHSPPLGYDAPLSAAFGVPVFNAGVWYVKLVMQASFGADSLSVKTLCLKKGKVADTHVPLSKTEGGLWRAGEPSGELGGNEDCFNHDVKASARHG